MGASTKAKEAASRVEEREEHHKIAPTAARDYTCSRCGKTFQNPEDPLHYRSFESGVAA